MEHTTPDWDAELKDLKVRGICNKCFKPTHRWFTLCPDHMPEFQASWVVGLDPEKDIQKERDTK